MRRYAEGQDQQNGNNRLVSQYRRTGKPPEMHDESKFNNVQGSAFTTGQWRFAFPVLCLTINSGSTTISLARRLSAGAPTARKTTSAAILPILRSGCLTVVSSGLECAALSMSSNPTTETSSGICRLECRKAR